MQLKGVVHSMNIDHKETLNIRQLVLASSSPRRRELVASLDLSLPVLILSSDVDEQTPPEWKPSHIVEQLGLRKALASMAMMSAEEHPSPSLVIGADTIVVWNGEVMGKPVDRTDAINMLTKLQGSQHEVYSGIACVETSSGRQLIAHRKTSVIMKPLSQKRIERYVDSGEPMDKAGVYANTMYHTRHSRFYCLDRNNKETEGIIATIGLSVSRVKFKSLTLDQIERYVSKGESMDKAGSYALQGIGSTLVEYIEGDHNNIIGLPLSLLTEMLMFHGVQVV